jgi:GH25 family lysozyme M1 (1,4-beta-N-acetylmuramidase)/Flp pilus assembly protein TadD
MLIISGNASMGSQSIYTVGGTVQAGSGFYIKRKADDELLQYCREGEFAFILSSRQVGKSSLMVRTAQQLEKENIRSVIIDLSSIGVKISADEWYLGILNDISNTLNLKTDIFSWWSERAGLGPAQRLTNFFRDVLLKEVSEPIVLFFDEIDSTLSIPFADDFFAALRAIYNARSTVPDFKRLSFVMIGVATPSDLIADDKRTPFNIGHRVDLTDFTQEEALPLAGELGAKTLGWVFTWTGGHPYLTQRLCAHLAKSKVEHTKEAVEAAVREIFEGEQGKQDNNLQFVRDMLTKRAPDIQRVLKTYKDVRSGKQVADDERSMPKSHLKISGVVHRKDVNLSTRNRIYERNFDLKWIKENTPSTTARKLIIASSIVTIIALMIAGAYAWQSYNRTPAERAAQFDGNFQSAQTPKDRLKNLAGLFELQDETFAAEARQLFNDMPQEDKLALFAPSDSQSVSEDQIIVVQGLYAHLGNTETDNQLLEQMAVVAPPFADEIKRWLEGRRILLTGKDYDAAVEKLTLAIGKNDQNPAVYFDRAHAYLEWGESYYPKVLADLDMMMQLDESRGLDAYRLINSNTPRGRASQFTGGFITAQSADTRLKNLAGLFNLQEDVLDVEARRLFMDLSQDDKRALFVPGSAQEVSEDQARVVRGVYTHLYNTGEDNQLLEDMAKVVPSLADEISLWLAGRTAMSEKDYQGGLEKLTLAIEKNDKNPALYYDRAQAYIGLGEEYYPEALSDLAIMVRLDKSRRADAYNTGANAPFSDYWNASITNREYKEFYVRAAGIDVSYWDAGIDWPSVKDFGIEFVFMKATEGITYKDPTLAERWESTKSVGIPRSAYHFFRANVDPIKQAEYFIQAVEAMDGDAELPPVLDMETNDGKSKEEFLAGIKIWLDMVEQAMGKKPIIYAGYFAFQDLFSDQNGSPPVWASEYHLWLAQYPTTYTEGGEPSLPRDWSDWTFWQYSDRGSVPGINAAVDMNVFNGSVSDLQQFLASTDVPVTQQSAQEKTFADLTLPIDANPYDAQAYVIRGIAYIYYGQYQQAIDDFTQAIKINPTDPQPYMQRGVAYARTGDYENAIANFDQAIRLQPEYADAYLNRGNAYEALGQMENAAADKDKYNELTGNTGVP